MKASKNPVPSFPSDIEDCIQKGGLSQNLLKPSLRFSLLEFDSLQKDNYHGEVPFL